MELDRADLHDLHFKHCRNLQITPWKNKATYRRNLDFICLSWTEFSLLCDYQQTVRKEKNNGVNKRLCSHSLFLYRNKEGSNRFLYTNLGGTVYRVPRNTRIYNTFLKCFVCLMMLFTFTPILTFQSKDYKTHFK